MFPANTGSGPADDFPDPAPNGGSGGYTVCYRWLEKDGLVRFTQRRHEDEQTARGMLAWARSLSAGSARTLEAARIIGPGEPVWRELQACSGCAGDCLADPGTRTCPSGAPS